MANYRFFTRQRHSKPANSRAESIIQCFVAAGGKLLRVAGAGEANQTRFYDYSMSRWLVPPPAGFLRDGTRMSNECRYLFYNSLSKRTQSSLCLLIQFSLRSIISSLFLAAPPSSPSISVPSSSSTSLFHHNKSEWSRTIDELVFSSDVLHSEDFNLLPGNIFHQYFSFCYLRYEHNAVEIDWNSKKNVNVGQVCCF